MLPISSPDISALTTPSPRARLRLTTTSPSPLLSTVVFFAPSPSALGKRPRTPIIPVGNSSPVVVVNGPSPCKRFCASPSSPRPPPEFPLLRAAHRERKPQRPARGLRLNIPMSASLSPADGASGSPRRRASSSEATVTPGLIRSIQGVQLSVSPPPNGDAATANAGSSSPRSPFPPKMSLRRSNPKGLSLSLAASFHNTPSSNETTPTPSAFCATPVSPTADVTPLTPGLPKTPALATNAVGGQPPKLHSRRPSLLSVITHPATAAPNAQAVPPTPGAQSAAPAYPYFPMRKRGHARMRSAGALLAAYGQQTEMDPRISQSAYPSVRGFHPIDERSTQAATSSHTSVTSTASASASSASATDSVSSTPSTSPPLPASSDERELRYPSMLSLEPYADGPIEIVPGVWLGAEDSLWFWDVWARGKASVAVINVAQEIENPFDPDASSDDERWAPSAGADKPGVKLTTHEVAGQPTVEYAHLRWSHGEGGLADVPGSALLNDVASAAKSGSVLQQRHWRFWEAIRWLEERRRAGIPVLIHCQCGVSRSATLAVAYVMTLAAAGMEPEAIGHIKTMQNAYDYVKAKSPWIGPNVSLVFQLVEYARNLSTLLSSHVSAGGRQWKTQWPTLVDIESEDAWAARRREFGDDDDSARSDEEARAEAEALDEAMAVRARRE